MGSPGKATPGTFYDQVGDAVDLVIGLGGLAVLVVTLGDLFVTVGLPRAARRLRISRWVWRIAWRITRWVALRLRSPQRRESLLGVYGPLSVFLVLAVWLVLLIFGFGAIVYSLREHIHPRPNDFPSALYLGGSGLLTIGYADNAGTSFVAKALGLFAAATGLTVFASVITFLYSLFASFREREIEVVSLEATAGAPPSGVAFLEFYKSVGLESQVGPAFERWQRWAAMVLDSHLAYPILAYFRSSHDNDSWISSLGAIMDAANLVLTTIEDGPIGHAKIAWWVGGHCIDDLAAYFGLAGEHSVGVELSEFVEARDRLAKAGYTLRPEAESWERFQQLRSEHAASVNALAIYWASPPAHWIGDRELRFRHPGRNLVS